MILYKISCIDESKIQSWWDSTPPSVRELVFEQNNTIWSSGIPKSFEDIRSDLLLGISNPKDGMEQDKRNLKSVYTFLLEGTKILSSIDSLPDDAIIAEEGDYCHLMYGKEPLSTKYCILKS